MDVPAWFSAEASAIGVEFEPGDLERLGRFLAMLLRANEALNLTAILEPEVAWRRHILDSLSLLPLIAEFPEGATVADVGTGGGLPGLPLALVLPSYRFSLLDATRKKCDFLDQAIASLHCANARTVCGRAEALAHDRGRRTVRDGEVLHEGGHRERYDVVVARAVGRLALLAEITVPFCKIGGRVLLIKGAKADEELAEAADVLHTLKCVHAGTMDTPTGRVVILEKRSATPRDLPRLGGETARGPVRSRSTRGARPSEQQDD